MKRHRKSISESHQTLIASGIFIALLAGLIWGLAQIPVSPQRQVSVQERTR